MLGAFSTGAYIHISKPHGRSAGAYDSLTTAAGEHGARRRPQSAQQGVGFGKGPAITPTVFLYGSITLGKCWSSGTSDLTLAQTRNLMLTIVGTVVSMRLNKLDQLQICDVNFATCSGV